MDDESRGMCPSVPCPASIHRVEGNAVLGSEAVRAHDQLHECEGKHTAVCYPVSGWWVQRVRGFGTIKERIHNVRWFKSFCALRCTSVVLPTWETE